MKNYFYKALNNQIVFLLSVLGFSMAANQCVAQYGAPIRTLEIKGVVITKFDEPISKVKVVSGYDTTLTDSLGNFYFVKDLPYSKNDVRIKFIDDLHDKYQTKDTVLFLTPEREKRVKIKLENKSKP